MSKKVIAATLFVVMASASAIALAGESKHSEGDSHGQDVHWGYEGKEGPEHWGSLKKEFSTCGAGTRQSPIDVSAGVKVDVSSSAIKFDYKKVKAEVINNGHTIQVNYPAGSSITVGDKKYNLLQFHFHTPSENIVAGRPYNMEMHLVHKSESGELAVVAVFIQQGKHNKALQQTWDVMPTKAGGKATLAKKFVATALLPNTKSYTKFNGSLTTPPCSEGVNWLVMNKPIDVSKKQLAKFLEVVGKNARPIQAINNRFVVGKK